MEFYLSTWQLYGTRRCFEFKKGMLSCSLIYLTRLIELHFFLHCVLDSVVPFNYIHTNNHQFFYNQVPELHSDLVYNYMIIGLCDYE